MGVPSARDRTITRWKVGGCVALIVLCLAVLVGHLWPALEGRARLDWGLIGVLVFGVLANVVGIFRAYAILDATSREDR